MAGSAVPGYQTKLLLGRYLPFVISGVVLLIVFSLIDLRSVYVQLKKADKILILLAFALTLPQLALRAYRWRYLMGLQEIKCSFKNAALFYIASMYVGMITPGRMGEISKALFLKANNVASISKAMPSVIIDRLLDAFALLVFVVVAAWQTKFFGLVSYRESYLYAALILLLLISLSPKLIQLSAKHIGAKLQRKSFQNWRLGIDEFVEGIGQLLNLHLLAAVLITLAHYGLFFLQAYLIARAVDIKISFLIIFTVVTLATLIGFIPVSAAGIGTRDAAFIILFKAVGIVETAALGFAVAFDIVCLLGTSIIGMVTCWFLPFEIRNLIKKGNKSANSLKNIVNS